ncbi:Serine/threonine-protein kinase CTR1 [Linum perenne]
MDYGGETAATTTAASLNKSWAQQTEESYQLQLALALRMSSFAALATDPNSLTSSSSSSPSPSPSPSDSAQHLSHRFWVNGCLSYYDRIPDGFYAIYGMDPYVWTISTDQRELGWIPSIDTLKAVDPHLEPSMKVVLVDRFKDPYLRELCDRVASLSSRRFTTSDAVTELATLVCSRMGGEAFSEEEEFCKYWMKCADALRNRLGSVILPIGSLSVGLCIHRALLFKVLADSINLPCRIAKGCKYCTRDVASCCLVQVGNEREYLVDLFRKPGSLSHPDSSLNCTSSVSASSPLSYPRFSHVQTAEDVKSMAKLYFFDGQTLKFTFDNTINPGSVINEGSLGPGMDNKSHVHAASNNHEAFQPIVHRDPPVLKPSYVTNSANLDKRPVQSSHKLRNGHQNANPFSVVSDNTMSDTSEWYLERKPKNNVSNDLHLEDEDLNIQWRELHVKEKIGEGSFGTVHRAEWRGSEVAVKILAQQDFDPQHLKEFLAEVAIMKRLRHPNIVLFMGAVTQPPHLSIVTEYLSRGSLHKLLHKPDARLVLDERRRLSMAYDVAIGMNYLHQLRPPIVHRDLKSPNLLVDSTYTVKVCDFGLSRPKANTYLSSKTAAGTPEWMAPEVLRNESSNEKSDVYSFGVILWELATLQQPWWNLKQAQVVEAVGFKGQTLQIPGYVNPAVATLIDACLTNDPSQRPAFSYIVETLKLIKNSVSQPARVHTT